MWVVALIVCLHGLLYQNDAAVLNWSKSYTLKAILRIPSADLSIPYQEWVNGASNRSKVDFYEGLTKLYRQWNEINQTYEYFKIHPDKPGKTDKEVCNKIPSEIADSIIKVINGYLLIKQWTYVGSEMVNNINTHKFTYKHVYTYTVWVEFKNKSQGETPVPVRFVSELIVRNMSQEHYLHDYLYFDDRKPDVQTLLMPLCMQCNPLPKTTLHKPIDIISKPSPSAAFVRNKEDINRYKTNRNNCDTTKDELLKRAISLNKPATILNFQDQQEKSLDIQHYLSTSYATGGTFQWSKSYTLKAVLTVPGANITEPYQVWLDGETGKSKVDFYHGMDKLYREYDTKDEKYKYYKIHPVSNTHMESNEVCNEVDANAPEIKTYALNSYLPVKRWTYVGDELLNEAETKKFVYEYPVKVNQKEVGKIVYSVWADFKQGAAVPVRFVYEVKTETKVLDNFRHDYTYFDNSKPDTTILEKPSGMNCKPLTVVSVHEPIDPLMEYIEPDLGHSRVEKLFDWFKTKHSKIYTNEDEHFKRMNIFKDNLRYINSFNRQHRSFTVGVNHLADLSKEELKVFLGTFNKNTDNFDIEGSGDYDNDADDDDDEEENYINDLNGVQANFDWRNYGAITSVKDQTTICSGCYAFTTAAAVESSAYIARGCRDLEEVSEQAIIDCSWGVGAIGNIGCSGGTYEYSLHWAHKHGLPLKSEYGPYLAMEGRCHAAEMNKYVMIDGFKKLDKQKRVIKETLRYTGPILVAIDAHLLSFTFYNGGIYDDSECSNNPNDRSHGVVVVGYGRKDEDYWIVKNSFGLDWGEDGYMRLAQARNRCGLKNYAFAVKFLKNESFNCKPLNE